MSEGVVETYYSIIYRITPECPSCNADLDDETEHHDQFDDIDKNRHHLVDCPGCGTRLELVISYEAPIYLNIQITPVNKNLT